MTWFLLALVAPFLYSITNYIDKGLLEKYFKDGGVGTLILFSALLSILAVPIILFIDPSVLSVSGHNLLIILIVAVLDIAILWLYLLALQGDEPSIVIVFYQLVPVFALGLGYILLGETLTSTELLAMITIIIGTTFVSFKLDDENNLKLRKRTVILMTLAAIAWALESVLFKVAALEESVIRSLFWEHLVLAMLGVIIFCTIKTYREHFIIALKKNSLSILGLNVTNESLYMVGNISVAFAVMLAPVALVLLGQSFQSIFVLIIGVTLTIFFPKIYSEDIERKYILQKLFAIIITGIGTYILLNT